MPLVRIEQVARRQHLRIELVVVEILAAKALAEYFIDLVELQPRFRIKRSKRPNRLRGKGPAIDQEENAAGQTRLYEPISLIHQRHGLARTGGHGDEHLALALSNGLFDGGVRLELIRPQPRMVVRHQEQRCTSTLKIPLHHLAQGLRRMKAGQTP